MQFEFPWELGPPPGRYVVRDHAGEASLRVVVLATLGARERRVLGTRRSRQAAPEPGAALVETTRATVIRGQPVGPGEADDWVGGAVGHVDPELGVLNRVLALHRVAAADPTVREVRREQALVVRVGYGAGEQVADGRWTTAVEPGQPRERRGRAEGALRPHERLAALLGGRDAALACEELTLRARADLQEGRTREAALQLRVALEAALAELEAWRDRGDMAARLDELRGHRGPVGTAANAALRGGLDADTIADVATALERVEAALRARSAEGFR